MKQATRRLRFLMAFSALLFACGAYAKPNKPFLATFEGLRKMPLKQRTEYLLVMHRMTNDLALLNRAKFDFNTASHSGLQWTFFNEAIAATTPPTNTCVVAGWVSNDCKKKDWMNCKEGDYGFDKAALRTTMRCNPFIYQSGSHGEASTSYLCVNIDRGSGGPTQNCESGSQNPQKNAEVVAAKLNNLCDSTNTTRPPVYDAGKCAAWKDSYEEFRAQLPYYCEHQSTKDSGAYKIGDTSECDLWKARLAAVEAKLGQKIGNRDLDPIVVLTQRHCINGHYLSTRKYVDGEDKKGGVQLISYNEHPRNNGVAADLIDCKFGEDLGVANEKVVTDHLKVALDQIACAADDSGGPEVQGPKQPAKTAEAIK